MRTDPKYWAFISYSHEDWSWSEWLHRAIETYRIPGRLVGHISRDGFVPARIFPIFRDQDELPTSADLNEAIVAALEQSRYLIVVCSPRSAQSRWVNEEVTVFKSLGRADRILCLIVDGEPNVTIDPEAAHLECFPLALRALSSASNENSTHRVEPLAADVRQGHAAIPDAKLRIVAGLLGLGFDELKQREVQRQRQGRSLGLIIASIFAGLLLLPDPGPVPAIRLAGFDAYQAWFPRHRESEPAVIVAIDDASIDRIGQYPWPRDILARILARIGACGPAAIAINVVFSEPDRLSPERIAGSLMERDPTVAANLRRMRPNDSILATTISELPVVLAVGAAAQGEIAGKFPPVQTIGRPAAPVFYPAAWRSLPIIDEAARGHGFVGLADSTRDTIRRVPIVAYLGEHAILSLGLESIRIAIGAPFVRLDYRQQNSPTVTINDLQVPVQADGTGWVYFSEADRAVDVVSAAAILDGQFDTDLFARKIVLLGVTATGLGTSVTGVRGERLSDMQLHRETIENLVDGKLLARPTWARPAEALTFLIAAILIVVWIPRVAARRSILLPCACCLALLSGSTIAFVAGRLLLDAATPIVGILGLFAAVMTYGYVSNSMRQSTGAYDAGHGENVRRLRWRR